MVDVSQIRTEQGIFTDAWNMLKMYYEAETIEDWKRLQGDVYLMATSYQDTDCAGLAKALAFAVLDHIDQHDQRKREVLQNAV